MTHTVKSNLEILRRLDFELEVALLIESEDEELLVGESPQ